jgi:anti-sigma-K factor RskA
VRARGQDALILEAIDRPVPAQGHVFQLWAVPPSGAPRSLGVLANADRGIVQVNLPAKLDDMLAGAAALAISEEGPGGSATGTPNLPPRYVGTLLKP